MNNKFARILDLLTIFALFLAACSLVATPSTDETQEATQPPGSEPPAGDMIEILSVSPPVPSGISIADPVTVMIRYNMTIPEGTLQVWFERFTDADCTITMADTTGATTLAGTLDGGMPGGLHEVTVNVPPLPLLEVAYVGVGVRLWTPDSNTILVEDMSYDVCYTVQAPPADLPVAASNLTPIPGGTGGVGAIAGIIFGDSNGNGLLDSGETGTGPYLLTLADTSCSTTFLTTNSETDGYYGFLGLPAGTYCVTISYTGGVVLPGYFQRVEVVATNTSEASFALQTGSASPPPSTTGYCGDGVLDTGSGEQCDPPNLTDCTASCQSYAGYCGNGIVDPSLGEQCDPPNITDCTASCQIYVAYCGNGFVDLSLGEQCDPPNIDFCTAQCQLYLPNCGNGVLDIGEECDPPNTTDCTAQCQSFP